MRPLSSDPSTLIFTNTGEPEAGKRRRYWLVVLEEETAYSIGGGSILNNSPRHQKQGDGRHPALA